MKKLKYFLLTLCAVVMCACCFSFKTNKVEAASININDKLKLMSMDIVDKDGQAGYELNLFLTNEIVSLLNLGRNTISYDQYETCALVIVCDYSGNSYNSTEFNNEDSINKSTFSYYNFPAGLSYSVYSTFSSSIVKCLEGVPNKDCCYVNENIDKFTNNFNVFIPHQMYSIGSDYLTVSDYTFYAFVFNYVEFYSINTGKFEFYDYDILYKSNKYIL